MIDIHTSSDQQSACKGAAEALEKTLKDTMGKPVLFFVSGGSGFDVLNELPGELLQPQITVSVIDERFSTDPAVNNFLQLQKTDFYKKALANGVPFVETIPKEGEMIEEMAKRFEDDLKLWHTSHPDGVMVALLGIGRDGHTAGIIGNPDDKRSFQFMFEDDSAWVAGYDAGSRNQYPLRVTVTMPLLRTIDTTIVYTVGETKKEALTAVLAPSGELHKTPGRIVQEMKHCLLYTDQAVDRVNS
jgi:6-phosphogluconolactonase/glucosamine-6-phosphate isomerase/deaminase